MSSCGVIQKLLLVFELCFSITAVFYFGRGLPEQADDEKLLYSVGCNADMHSGLCFVSDPEALDTVIRMNQRAGEANFGLAILSLAIIFVRLMSWQLDYGPRYANLLYDLLMSGLWCFNLARQLTSTGLVGCRYEHVGLIKELGICRMNIICVSMAMIAIVLYSGRVLVDAGSLLGDSPSTLSNNNMWEDDEIHHVYHDELQKAQADSFSPVLSFFPAGH
ncbi:hypothetical protein NOR_06373 [Metarhizium rileyi]|uniref:Transmembrane protein n=1 Tax=Metarhizium rileyi (strain RCEF 4871) TaxID=1649241 RepID=A0A167ANU4_METRR|nr:hypothetical protein NOR_06373 [Metarhizium rileyi RCEF 4871]